MTFKYVCHVAILAQAGGPIFARPPQTLNWSSFVPFARGGAQVKATITQDISFDGVHGPIDNSLIRWFA